MDTEIQHVRDLERALLHDIKNANNIVEIRKVAANDNLHKDVRIAAIHTLRRIFITFAEENKVTKPSVDNKSKSVEKFYSWFIGQYHEYQQLLCGMLQDADKDWAHEIAVRTMLEVGL
jgi:hypothetical protein